MGAACTPTPDGMRVTGTGPVRGITADLGDVSEIAPVLTALAALADSPSVFTGIGHMRTHESDRLAALAGEIGALGGDVTERQDGLEIRPRPLRARRHGLRQPRRPPAGDGGRGARAGGAGRAAGRQRRDRGQDVPRLHPDVVGHAGESP